MNHSHAIQKLLKLTKEKRDEAARRLTEAMVNYDTSEKKLHMLEQYRDDYLKRQHQELKEIAYTQKLEQYRAFVIKLEQAAEQQKNDLDFRKKTLQITREKFIDYEKRLQSLGLYIQKQASLLSQAESKKEQKLMDEYAAGIAQRALTLNGNYYESTGYQY
jgi:flagellar FliJ protein